jgi:hypothetical protein
MVRAFNEMGVLKAGLDLVGQSAFDLPCIVVSKELGS